MMQVRKEYVESLGAKLSFLYAPRLSAHGNTTNKQYSEATCGIQNTVVSITLKSGGINTVSLSTIP